MSIIEAAPSLGAGDIGELYGALAARLEQIVRLDVRASDAVIEDACQVAWCRLLGHGERVQRETAMAWLARTAVHEAFRSLRRCRREQSLEGGIEEAGDLACIRTPAMPGKLFEERERLNQVGLLSVRQQRLLWLHAFGLTYAEIAAHEKCTQRTVERQLLRARAALREQDRALDL
ncbi:MAG: sigma-70 family RNA polymerase sigma factor [Solirubrobacterales bacterium]|nr:sigma-70 family RNA polymerase sigma factor [Solirubrobacterales bacterium]